MVTAFPHAHSLQSILRVRILYCAALLTAAGGRVVASEVGEQVKGAADPLFDVERVRALSLADHTCLCFNVKSTEHKAKIYFIKSI